MHRVVWRIASMMKTTCIEKQRYKNGKIVKYIIKDLKSGQYFEAYDSFVTISTCIS